MKHNRHEYQIIFCDPKEYRSEGKGCFWIEMTLPTSGTYHKTYDAAEEEAKHIIDEFVVNIPQTKQEWIDSLSKCMVWTGYEDCHLDEDMVWSLLQKANKHLKTKGEDQ